MLLIVVLAAPRSMHTEVAAEFANGRPNQSIGRFSPCIVQDDPGLNAEC